MAAKSTKRIRSIVAYAASHGHDRQALHGVVRKAIGHGTLAGGSRGIPAGYKMVYGKLRKVKA